MNLELLANELLLDVFEYFHAVELLRAFHRLNTRFDELIIIYFKNHRFDFQNASKKDFHTACTVNLPLVTDHIVSLGLSDDDETPQQIYLFRSLGWTLNRFQHLHSLFLDNIRMSEIITEILSECPQLIHLSLNSCYFEYTSSTILQFMNTVWNLQQLAYCYLKLILKHDARLPIPTEISLSMKHLSILGVTLRIKDIIALGQHTPSLLYLAVEFSDTQIVQPVRTPIALLTELNLVYIGFHHDILQNMLQCVPNLCKFKIETFSVEMTGHEWEQAIRSYLPKLHSFQLKMRFHIRTEKRHKEILRSFQTRFWLEEHQWPVRCHYNLEDMSNMACLYTLPYSFSYVDILFPVHFKSTGLTNENDYLSYDFVQQLDYRSTVTSEALVSSFDFPNVTCLSISLPIGNHLLSIIQKLDRLSTLKVSRPRNMPDMDAQIQLQNILDCVPNVLSLNFSHWREEQLMTQSSSMVKKLTPLVIKTHSIHLVNLRGYDCWFNDDECAQLSNSSLGNKCEVLWIKVQNRLNIIHLVESLCHLRALVVQSRDDNWTYSSRTEDQHVQWLQENLPPMCSVRRDTRLGHHIRIWVNS